VSDGTGWPGGELPDGESYNTHANVKLTAEQKQRIADSGESESQWIREAVQERLDREAFTRRLREHT
jgi:hypothetical protein